MYVTTHMTAPAVTINLDTPLTKARQTMDDHRIHHLPVVDDEGHLLGIVSDRDLRSALPSSILPDEEHLDRSAPIEGTEVRAIMSRPLYFLNSLSTLDDALYLFNKSDVGALPVIANDNRVIGILAVRNLLAAYRKLFGLGERGSALVAVEDDGRPKPLTRIVKMMENEGIRFTRLIRTEEEPTGSPRIIYLRVHTINMKAVHDAISKAGFKMILPSHTG